MNFEFCCVYNPELGTEEDVEPQMVYKIPANNDPAKFVKLIGLAQGIAELAYSFGGEPVKWFKTGRKGNSKIVLVVPLFNENHENWRSGFWFTGQLPWTQDSLSAEVAYRLVKLAFRQHCLIYGNPPSKNIGSHRYWDNFSLEGFNANLSAVYSPGTIQIAPGSLNPSSKSDIDSIVLEYNSRGLLITVCNDGASVYDGGKISILMKSALQVWLEEAIHQDSEDRNILQVANRNNEWSTDNSSGPTNAEAQERGQDQDQDQERQEETEVGDRSRQDPGHEIQQGGSHSEETDLENNSPRVSRSISSRFIPDISSLTSFSMNLPSVSLPSVLPSVQLPQLSLSSFSPASVSEWWNAPPKAVNTDGILLLNHKLYDLDSGDVVYVTVWRRTLYLYTAVFDNPVDEHTASQMFEALSSQLDGFSFAFEPPTRFYYLIHNPRKSTIVSTFPSTLANNETIRTLMAPINSEQKVVRLGSTWLYFLQIAADVHAVFGKKNISTQQPTLLGALHSDVQQWVDEYARKYL